MRFCAPLFYTGFQLCLRRTPLMGRQIHGHARKLRPFAFEEAALLAAIRLAGQNFALFANHAVPGDSLTRRATGHGIANRPRAAGKSQHFGELAVSHHLASRNALHEVVHFVPAAASLCHLPPNLWSARTPKSTMCRRRTLF